MSCHVFSVAVLATAQEIQGTKSHSIRHKACLLHYGYYLARCICETGTDQADVTRTECIETPNKGRHYYIFNILIPFEALNWCRAGIESAGG
jgi:hypothetical protein